MKGRIHNVVFLCVFSLLYGAVVIKVYIDDERKLKQQIEPSFIYAIEEDLKMRFDLSGIYYHYTYDPIQNDSIQSMSSIMDEQFHVLHTLLKDECPINVNTIDSLFSKQLKEKGCTDQTGVKHIDHSLNVIKKSENNTQFYKSADTTRQIPIGYYSEMSLQGFVHITPLSVIRSAKEHYFLLSLVYLLSLLLAIFFINIRSQKTFTETLEKQEDKRTIIFNRQKKRLENGRSGQVALTAQQALLIDYMLNSENYYISNEQMKQLLWNSKDFIGNSRQYQSIDRLRKKLESIPEIKIVNEHGHGYSLMIDETIDFRYTTPHTSPQSDLHTSQG